MEFTQILTIAGKEFRDRMPQRAFWITVSTISNVKK